MRMAGLEAFGPSLIEDAIEHLYDPLAELGLSPGSYSKEEIKAAYKAAAKDAHPDRGGDTARFSRVQLAFLALSDFAAAFSEYGMFGAVMCRQTRYEAAVRAQARLSLTEFTRESACLPACLPTYPYLPAYLPT